MKVTLKNFGVFKQVEYELADFTIICGKNNSGKTYATYALFGFIDFLKNGFQFEINNNIINNLFEKGTENIDLFEYSNHLQDIINKACEQYKKFLPFIFATSETRFKDSEFHLALKKKDVKLNNTYNRTLTFTKNDFLQISKEMDKEILSITFPRESKEIQNASTIDIIKKEISNAIKALIFESTFPNVFIASAERTGISIFEDDINANLHNRLIKRITHSTQLNINEIIAEFYNSPYPIPVTRNILFNSQLKEVVKLSSIIDIEHKDILIDFADILGGEYKVDKEGLWFIPKKTRGIKLSLGESSSSVRSLLDVGFYLKHIAQKGDMLMIDEPELNLHPENQRKFARLLVRLVNIGIKVFVTTHSDYIIKELNTLIMLNFKKDQKSIIDMMIKYHYSENELISPDKIKVFIACVNKRIPSLKLANIDPFYGIEAASFDITIDEMNNIQKSIVFDRDLR
ncbi:MAG: AAA family ATPase [Candidatus Kapabacteria bacterium]|nr:AAA family ATPase [Candidatus Kapabacteria bacterium]